MFLLYRPWDLLALIKDQGLNTALNARYLANSIPSCSVEAMIGCEYLYV